MGTIRKYWATLISLCDLTDFQLENGECEQFVALRLALSGGVVPGLALPSCLLSAIALSFLQAKVKINNPFKSQMQK